MGRQRTKVACIECNKAAAKYPENYPIVCNLYCADAHIKKTVEQNLSKYQICKTHMHFIDTDTNKCPMCMYEDTNEGRDEIVLEPDSKELEQKKEIKGKLKEAVTKWVEKPRPAVDLERIKEYREDFTPAEYAAWFNKDTEQGV